MLDPFNSPYVIPCRYLLALYIENRRPKITSWKAFSRSFGPTEKTVKDIRDDFGIDVSVGRDAQPSPDFHGPDDYFLGEGI